MRRLQKKIVVPKNCYFCKEKKEPFYGEIETLRRYLTERGKIVPRSRNGLCSKHQRVLTFTIKHARFLALLPFIANR
ncbi:MAG: 30S ribosomal protein S18 [Candidatus Levyibacteriota bacterium]